MNAGDSDLDVIPVTIQVNEYYAMSRVKREEISFRDMNY